MQKKKLFQMNNDDPNKRAALFDNTLCSLLDCHVLLSKGIQ